MDVHFTPYENLWFVFMANFHWLVPPIALVLLLPFFKNKRFYSTIVFVIGGGVLGYELAAYSITFDSNALYIYILPPLFTILAVIFSITTNYFKKNKKLFQICSLALGISLFIFFFLLILSQYNEEKSYNKEQYSSLYKIPIQLYMPTRPIKGGTLVITEVENDAFHLTYRTSTQDIELYEDGPEESSYVPSDCVQLSCPEVGKNKWGTPVFDYEKIFAYTFVGKTVITVVAENYPINDDFISFFNSLRPVNKQDIKLFNNYRQSLNF